MEYTHVLVCEPARGRMWAAARSLMRTVVRYLVWLGSLVGLVACQGMAMDDVRPPIATQSQAIMGGSLDRSLSGVTAIVAGKTPFCTGTLVAPRLVVTAAHCLSQAKRYGLDKVKVRVDFVSGNSEKTDLYDVLQWLEHPQYARTSAGMVFDVGVIVLKDSVSNVRPYKLYTTALTSRWVGKKLRFAGYGLVRTQPIPYSYGKRVAVDLTVKQVLRDRVEAKDSRKSICTGDSGGPGLAWLDNSWQVVAFSSYVTGRSNSRGPLCDGSSWAFRADIVGPWLQSMIDRFGTGCKVNSDCGPCYQCNTANGNCELQGSKPLNTFCQPCDADSVCGQTGQGLCQKQAQGYRCLQACDANRCCPMGSSCQNVDGQFMCVPSENICKPVACRQDKDCGPGESCQKDTCKPKPVSAVNTLCKPCAKDSDCGKGMCVSYEEGSYCTQPCEANLFCPEGYSCESIRGTFQCKASSGNCRCKEETDCHEGFACQDNICERPGGGEHGDACSSLRKCASGYECLNTANGRVCVQTCTGDFPPGSLGSVCKTGGQCTSGARCFSVSRWSICLKVCSSESSCVGGGQCRKFSLSVAACYCTKDEDCRRGYACNKSILKTWGQCERKESERELCKDGYTCEQATEDKSLCLPPPSREPGEACDSIFRCKEGLLCAKLSTGDSVCVRACRTANDCKREGGACIVSGSMRFCSCNSSVCASNARCKNLTGNTKICVEGPCTKDSDCGVQARCKRGVCQTIPVVCTHDLDCEPYELCKNKLCSPRPSCQTQADCTPSEACQGGTCVRSGCETDLDCRTGQVCSGNECIKKRTCFSDKDCEVGEICTEAICRKDTSVVPTETVETEAIPNPAEPSMDGGVVDKIQGGVVDSYTSPPMACGCQAPDTSPIPLLFVLLAWLGVGWRRRA